MHGRVALFDLSTILWQERRLLSMLEHGASARFALQVAEIDRAVVVQDLVQTLELDDDVTLRDIAAAVPDPWPVVLDEHHDALRSTEPSSLPRSLAEFLR
jgi:hypothetical protein